MPENQPSIFESPFFLVIIIIIAIAVIVYFVLKRRKKPTEFKPQPLKTTFENELKAKVNTHGIPIKGGLIRDFRKVGFLDRYLIIKLKMPIYEFDIKTKHFKTLLNDKNPEQESEHMILRCKASNFFWRLLGRRKIYYIFDMKFYNKMFSFDPSGKNIILQGQIDLTRFGEIWVLSESDIEYLSNVSIKRMVEQTNMWLENNPDKVAHLDTGQARMERTNKQIAELDKAKWEERKNAGDSTIT